VVPDQYELRRQLAELADHNHRAVAYQIEDRRTALSGLLRRLEWGLPNLDTWRRRVDDLARGVHSGTTARLGLARSRVEGMEYRLKALDPVATLGRGFSVVENLAAGRVVTSTTQVAAGDPLAITVTDGVISATAGNLPKPKTSARKKSKSGLQAQPMERLL
jgi:exonuclease VII large subunit